MPNQDKTGPLGQGPLTGRGLGLCGRGLAFRRGRGRGRGLGLRGFQQIPLEKKDEKKLLQDELKAIDTEKKEIEKRLKELKD